MLSDKRWAHTTEVYVLHGNFSVAGQWEAKYYGVESYIIHTYYNPSFLGGRGPYDMALIKLEDRVVTPKNERRYPGACAWRKCRSNVAIGTLIGLGSDVQLSTPEYFCFAKVVSLEFCTMNIRKTDIHEHKMHMSVV